MDKTKSSIKEATLKLVIDKLSKDEKYKKFVDKLKSEKQLDSAYIIANRYARNYIHHKQKKEREKFIKRVKALSDEWIKNGSKWIESNEVKNEVNKSPNINNIETLIAEKQIVKESNDEFENKIEMADRSISNNRSKIVNGELIIKLLVNNDVIQLSKESVEKLGIKTSLLAKKGDTKYYYCDGIGGVFEII